MSLDVLIVEDVPEDAELVTRVLTDAGFEFEWTRVDTAPDYVAALETRPDVILADHDIPGFGAIPALAIREECFADIPLIVVTGHVGDERAAACIKAGAIDFVLKDNLARLPYAVERALKEKQLHDDVLRAEARYR